MPITRAFLASYYDKYPFAPLSQDASRLTEEIHSMAIALQKVSPLTQGKLVRQIYTIYMLFLAWACSYFYFFLILPKNDYGFSHSLLLFTCFCFRRVYHSLFVLVNEFYSYEVNSSAIESSSVEFMQMNKNWVSICNYEEVLDTS